MLWITLITAGLRTIRKNDFSTIQRSALLKCRYLDMTYLNHFFNKWNLSNVSVLYKNIFHNYRFRLNLCIFTVLDKNILEKKLEYKYPMVYYHRVVWRYDFTLIRSLKLTHSYNYYKYYCIWTIWDVYYLLIFQ